MLILLSREAAIESDVGPRLRALRTRLGLSQRALAKRAGVPSSTVSLIEGGHTNPSIGSLKRLVDAAGISLGDFFNLEVRDENQVFFKASDLVEISRGDVSYRQVGASGASSLQILYETYQPRSDSGRILLSHEGEEGGIVISGKLEVTVGDQTYGAVSSRPIVSDRMIKLRRQFDLAPPTLLYAAVDVDADRLRERIEYSYTRHFERLSKSGNILALGDLRVIAAGGPDTQITGHRIIDDRRAS